MNQCSDAVLHCCHIGICPWHGPAQYHRLWLFGHGRGCIMQQPSRVAVAAMRHLGLAVPVLAVGACGGVEVRGASHEGGPCRAHTSMPTTQHPWCLLALHIAACVQRLFTPHCCGPAGLTLRGQRQHTCMLPGGAYTQAPCRTCQRLQYYTLAA